MTIATQPYSAWNVNAYEFPRHGILEEKLKFILNYAILAPSLHNTQPWKFIVHENEIRILADRTRQLKVADPDARELYISLGCTLENLLTAAIFFGLWTTITYFPSPDDEIWVATITFRDTGDTSSLADQERFHAISLRHTSRQRYTNNPVTERDLQSLYACIHQKNVKLAIIDDPDVKREIDALAISGDITQFANPDYRDELTDWVSQGEFGYRWLISRIGHLATTYLDSHHSPTQTNANIILNAPLLGLISTPNDDRLAQVKAGQAFESIALSATTLNIGIQPLSQILQVSDLKPEVSKLFNSAGTFPQIAFRLGYTDIAQDATPRKGLDVSITP